MSRPWVEETEEYDEEHVYVEEEVAVENVEVKEYDEDEELDIEESDMNEEQVERRGETKICECDECHK